MTAASGLLPAGALDALGPLAPARLPGLEGWDDLTRAVLVSLAANVLTVLVLARRRAGAPVREPGPILSGEARALAGRFLAPAQVAGLLEGLPDAAAVDAARSARIEHELAAVLGAASARLLLDTARRGGEVAAVAEIVGEASPPRASTRCCWKPRWKT